MKSPYTAHLQLLVHHGSSTTPPKALRWAPKKRMPAPINPAAARRGSRTTGIGHLQLENASFSKAHTHTERNITWNHISG